jgi:hypothetical protein
MTRNLIVIFFLSLLYSFNVNNNSLFSFSKSAKVTSLGSIHFISNDISGVFFQPISNKRNIKTDYYFSFINQYDIKSNILQLAYCIDHDDHKNISFGIIKRNINNLYNTSSSWDTNNSILNLEDIQYENISKLSYEEFSLIFSYSRYLENSIFNIKVKPLYHRIESNRAFGINIDLISNYQLNNINILFGLNNIFSYKKWDSDLSEKSEIEYFSSMSFQLEKINIYFELSNLIKKKIAIECKINKNIFLRSGYNSIKRLSYGIGIDLNSIDINYSNLDLGLLGDSHQISIIIKLDN